ncbi:TVP38/TMEM64 family protein [Klebsiella pneumoniae subsp. pneumoniae]|nr:TVP38/TMEM64 family protein [Klebsiella pneumoniae subsp. pneumoniae]
MQAFAGDLLVASPCAAPGWPFAKCEGRRRSVAAWLWVSGGRTSAAAPPALASYAEVPSRGFIAAWGPHAGAGLICADDPPRRVVAPLPAFLITPGQNAALFGLPGAGAPSSVPAPWSDQALLCCAQALGREVVLQPPRCRADGYFPLPDGGLPHRLSRLTRCGYAARITSLRFWPFMLACRRLIIVPQAGSLHGGTFSHFCPGSGRIAKNIYRERHKRSSP